MLNLPVLLSYILHPAAVELRRAVFTSGKSSTAAGLTASVVKVVMGFFTIGPNMGIDGIATGQLEDSCRMGMG